MAALDEWWRRLGVLARRGRFDEDLDEEMRLHLEMEAQEAERGGLPRVEAERLAHRRFGSRLRAREDCLDAWGWTALDALARDARQALRSMRRAPASSFAAAASLALGIGAATALFSVMYALLLRPLPVERPSELRFLTEPARGGGVARFSYAAFREVKDGAPSLASVAAVHNPGPGIMQLPDGTLESLHREWAAPRYFATLGLRPVLGRIYTDEEDAAAAGVIVIGEKLWERVFARSPSAVGSVLRENGRSYTIVGVLPAAFTGLAPERTCQVWFPASRCNAKCLQDPGCETFKLLVRVSPGVSEQRAAREADAALRPVRFEAAGRLAQADRARILDRSVSLAYAGAGESYLGRVYRKPLFVLLGIVGVLLLMMCANIGTLLLSRTASRSRELATRLAMGATGPRLALQMLTESLVLAVIGGAAGVWLATYMTEALVSHFEIPYPARPDAAVLGLGLALSLAAGLLFGISPAVSAARSSVTVLLRGGGGAGRAKRRDPARLLVVAQVALSLVLVAAAGLFVSSFASMASQEAGFSRQRLVTFSVATPNGHSPSADPAIWRLLEAVRRRADVVAASAASPPPPSGGPDCRASVQGYEPRLPEDAVVEVTEVAEGFFEALGIPLRAGRLLEERDRGTSRAVSLVNETFARRFFGGRDPVGRDVEMAMGAGEGARSLGKTKIVGVVADARLRHPGEDVRPSIFPMTPYMWPAEIVVRTASDPDSFMASLPRFVRDTEPGLRLVRARTVAAETKRLMVREQVLAEVSGFFALLALVLAAVGIYGVVAQGVSARTREIGIRLALGARPAGVRRMVVGQALGVVLLGLALGLGAALAAGRLVASLLYAVRPSDFLALSLAAAALLAVALAAALIPARRAAAVTPLEAARCE